MKTHRGLASLVLYFVAVSAGAAPRPGFPTTLEGTGRTCWGHLRHTGTALDWKLPFLRCKSPYTVVSQTDLQWSLKVHKGAACSFERIEVKSSEPGNPKATFWSVTGYIHAEDVGRVTPDMQGCAMYPVGHKPL